MAGNFAADYTGILSVPAVEHRVILLSPGTSSR